ncbi:uncharacterized protein RCO7_14330 [Rhynchosporium graminicola]|uniref:Uncharacterized protein n=1 Tax=Rhynchosporium graminicola TaxID=2792576 RepID=A0A1E1K9U7_9HELO|nr:uncharacterized protein RCO7_14330 [Rhynchosporium commune]
MSDIPSMRNDWNIKPLSMFGVKCAGHEGAAVVVKSDADVQNWKFSNRGGIKPLLDFCCAYIVIAHVAGPIMCSASTMHRAFIDAFPKVGHITPLVRLEAVVAAVGIQCVQFTKAMWSVCNNLSSLPEYDYVAILQITSEM